MDIQDFQQFAVEKRRQLHKVPEVGFTEYITTYEVYKELEDTAFELYTGRDVLSSEERMGLPDEALFEDSRARALKYGVPEKFLDNMKGGHTGLVAVLDTGLPGPHTAFRFDIDGLPIPETDDNSHLPHKYGFRSSHAGEMHACGHDGHTSAGLAAAKFIDANKADLKGRFTIIFQPAEEGGRGAKSVVAKGWLDDADYFMSGHLGIADYGAGTVSATSEEFLASTKFDVEFTGKSAHAGLEPNAGSNALLAASTAVVNLNAIPRHRDGATRINVGTLNGGSGRNVIADKAEMMVETRGETSGLNDYMHTEAQRVIRAAADMYNVKADIKFMGKAPGAVCSGEFIDIIKAATVNNTDIKELKDALPLKASEDVTYMLNRVRERGGLATFMIFACPLEFGHHHPQFDVDEEAIRTFVSTMGDLIVYLNNKE